MEIHAALMVIVVVALAAAAAGAEEATWSVKKLPGCDNLPTRMAAFYKPVAVTVKPAAPQYKLPLDLTKLTNADFADKLHELGDKALADKFNALLRGNGFAAIGIGGHSDVAKFYTSLETRGLPIFVTSDSLLHLYHIQFDETLKDIEEREFFDDAAAISKAIQTEALKLYRSSDGEVQKAARLLVGYATVPVVVLSRTSLSVEAVAALKEVKAWSARTDWPTMQASRRSTGSCWRCWPRRRAGTWTASSWSRRWRNT